MFIKFNMNKKETNYHLAKQIFFLKPVHVRKKHFTSKRLLGRQSSEKYTKYIYFNENSKIFERKPIYLPSRDCIYKEQLNVINYKKH